MALTQQLARVTLQYVEQCWQTAAASPDKGPCWDPPEDDLLDLDWAIWGLITFFRRAHIDERHLAALERSIAGDDDGDVGFFDHPAAYDGFDAPPALLAPAAVSEVAHALNAIDLARALNQLPADSAEAAQACGFEAFTGHPRDYLVQQFNALRNFYNTARTRELAVLTWID
ncbi:DUF1877 family protein [Streptomyces sp. NPDC048248]|uniref:DUF1877 family protein n=1 Tax=Streptomyces sp. NPDC048248 TaxID=3365523 RepID=UPI00371912DA